jgi:hypothetical protein
MHIADRKDIGRARARRTRGSVLLAAAVMAFCIAIALTSYLKVAVTSVITADRAYYQNAGINLAEVGVEEAVYSYNKLNEVTVATDAWVGWTINGNSATRVMTGFNPGPGVTAIVKVYCSLYNPTLVTDRPKIVSQVTFTFPSGPSLVKCLEVTLRRRSLFPQGMLVRRTVTAHGNNISIDSWDSEDDGNPATPMVAYSTSTRRANATLATTSAENDAIDLGNGDVYGYIYTAQNADGSGGAVRHLSQAKLTGNFSSSEWDTDRISHDFDVSTFMPITLPSATPIQITENMEAGTLPRVGDAAVNGVYYYNFASGYRISLNSGTLRITDKVVITLGNHSGVSAVDVSGSGSGGGVGGMHIASGASLKIYTNGDISITGQGGLSNANSEPSSCVFYGTHTTEGGQTFRLTGNGQTSVSLYGPNANIYMSGGGSGGDFYGAIVGNLVDMDGHMSFHYDEALSKLYIGDPWGVSKWRELETAADRASYAANLPSDP